VITMTSTSVLRRINDRLVAPRASQGELLVAYTTAVAGSALATVLAADAGVPALPLVVVAVVAFDLFGGAVVNATPAAKRRFHGPGRTRRHHLGFVVAHVQPFVLALVVPGFGWTAAAVVYGLVVVGAAVVLAAPEELRRPVAFAATVLAVAAVLVAVAVPTALAWVAPVLFVKLLLGHLLPGEAA
jgi:hypothetical protein